MSLIATTTRANIDRAIRATGVAAFVLVAVGTLMAAFYAPLLDERACALGVQDCITSPLGQKIFYFHVPVAIAAYAALTALAVASYRTLARDDVLSDAFAASSAESGVLFAAITLFTGSLWGHLEWGEQFGYWNNSDTKLVLTLVLFLVYAAYLVLRRQIDDARRRRRVAAVYGLFGFATVPLSYLAQRLWSSRHPTVFDPGNPEAGITVPAISHTFIVNVIAMVVLVAFIVLVRFRLELRRLDADAEVVQ